MKTRDSIFQVADQVVVAPGPGHYNPVLPSTVVGCKALAAKVILFSSSIVSQFKALFSRIGLQLLFACV